MSKKYLDTVGLNKLVANILSKFAAKNHSHSNATTNSAGFMSSSDKVKLDGVAAGANKTIVDSSLNGTSTNAIQNKAVKTALDGKASSSHTHPTAQITGLDSALASKASASHKHNAGDITSGTLPIARGGTGTTSADGIRGAIGINPVTTGGTGEAYTATVNGITSLIAGAEFMMVPHTVSTTTTPTLNVNGLGAKSIRRRVSNSTVTTVAASSANWLGAGKPIKVVYDGLFWIADFDRPNAADIYGTISSGQIADGSINLAKLASDIETVAVGASQPTDSHVKIWIQTT